MSKNSIALKIREPRRLAQGTLGRRYTTPLWRCNVVLRLAQAVACNQRDSEQIGFSDITSVAAVQP